MSQTRLVFERLRTAIVEGRLLPSSKLNIAALAEELAVSAGAVREGLAMLEAEALVVSEPARGFRVSPVSALDLRNLVEARIQVEQLCLAEAIRHGDLAWEGRIVSALHRLTRIAEREAEQPRHLNPEWAANHGEFHHALVSGCPNEWRYRFLTAPLAATERDVKAEHQAIVDAVLGRDIPTAQALIARHLDHTAQLLLDSPHLNQAREAQAGVAG
jgi:DNA-binding GntR family transcriptional regulator